jgi:hypothetical protein
MGNINLIKKNAPSGSRRSETATAHKIEYWPKWKENTAYSDLDHVQP